MKKYLALAFCFLSLLTSIGRSQDPSKPGYQNNFTGTLEYAFPIMTSVPPVGLTQPPDIQADYLWLDDAFRMVKPGAMDSYLSSLPYNDTSKYIASILYKVVADNPLTFLRWTESAPSPYPYKANPARERSNFDKHFGAIANDTGISAFLLDCDIIVDVRITDTIISEWPLDNATPVSIRVTATLLDSIKGKYVPSDCDFIHGIKTKGLKTLSITPRTLDTVPALPGVCMQFEYCPNWGPGIGEREAPFISTGESTWNWLQPDSEYVVFLKFTEVSRDSVNQYEILNPLWGEFGTSTAMYPVRNGVVVDPNDDFNIGAGVSGGLTVSVWKTRVRSRINNIINP